jgi:hypothetical protein
MIRVRMVQRKKAQLEMVRMKILQMRTAQRKIVSIVPELNSLEPLRVVAVAQDSLESVRIVAQNLLGPVRVVQDQRP